MAEKHPLATNIRAFYAKKHFIFRYIGCHNFSCPLKTRQFLAKLFAQRVNIDFLMRCTFLQLPGDECKKNRLRNYEFILGKIHNHFIDIEAIVSFR